MVIGVVCLCFCCLLLGVLGVLEVGELVMLGVWGGFVLCGDGLVELLWFFKVIMLVICFFIGKE